MEDLFLNKILPICAIILMVCMTCLALAYTIALLRFVYIGG
jgi:hypothetical protein